MLPAGLLAALGIDIGVLVQTSPAAAALDEMFSIAKTSGPAQGIFSRFRKLVSFAPGGLEGLTASELYRASKYWFDQGGYINKYQGDYPIDPRLAQTVRRNMQDFDPIRRYSYVFGVTVTDPQTGATTVLHRQLNSGVPLSIDEARAQLEELMILKADKYPVIRNEPGVPPPPPPTFTFEKMLRYSYGAKP